MFLYFNFGFRPSSLRQQQDIELEGERYHGEKTSRAELFGNGFQEEEEEDDDNDETDEHDEDIKNEESENDEDNQFELEQVSDGDEIHGSTDEDEDYEDEDEKDDDEDDQDNIDDENVMHDDEFSYRVSNQLDFIFSLFSILLYLSSTCK